MKNNFSKFVLKKHSWPGLCGFASQRSVGCQRLWKGHEKFLVAHFLVDPMYIVVYMVYVCSEMRRVFGVFFQVLFFSP